MITLPQWKYCECLVCLVHWVLLAWWASGAKNFLTGWISVMEVLEYSDFIRKFFLAFSFWSSDSEGNISTWSWSSWGKNQGKVKDHRQQGRNKEYPAHSGLTIHLKSRKQSPPEPMTTNTPQRRIKVSSGYLWEVRLYSQSSSLSVEGQPQLSLTSQS